MSEFLTLKNSEPRSVTVNDAYITTNPKYRGFKQLPFSYISQFCWSGIQIGLSWVILCSEVPQWYSSGWWGWSDHIFGVLEGMAGRQNSPRAVNKSACTYPSSMVATEQDILHSGWLLQTKRLRDKKLSVSQDLSPKTSTGSWIIHSQWVHLVSKRGNTTPNSQQEEFQGICGHL